MLDVVPLYNSIYLLLPVPSTYSDIIRSEKPDVAEMFEQLKVLGLAVIEAIPQLSLDPLSIIAPVIETVPPAPRYTVMSLQTAIGAVISLTVTVTEAEEVKHPFASVTVTEYEPAEETVMA